MQPLVFLQDHFVGVWLLAVGWIVAVAVISAVYRLRQGKPIFRPKFSTTEFSERWCSGCSSNGPLGRFGWANNCLWVTVAEKELSIFPQFPFNLILLPGIFGLEHRIPADDILSFERQQKLFRGRAFLIRFRNEKGIEEAFQLIVRNVDEFVPAIEQIRGQSDV